MNSKHKKMNDLKLPKKMEKIKKARFALPNLVTLGSVFCSFLSMTFVFQSMALAGQDRIDMLMYGALAILGSILFDTCDGKVARWTHSSSKFGMELDSLADGVSFGVAPAVLVYGFALNQAGWFGIIACFLFISGALLRLARFNIEAPDEGVQTYFKGIPAPAGAACLAAIVIACIDINFIQFSSFELNTLAWLIIFVGLLMVSSVKYKTLKGKKTPGDIAFIIVGLLFFGTMCYLKTPAIAFFLLVCYFVIFGMLNTVYLNIKREPRRHSRKRRKTIEMQAVKVEESSPETEESDTKSENSADDSELTTTPAEDKTENKSGDSEDDSENDSDLN